MDSSNYYTAVETSNQDYLKDLENLDYLMKTVVYPDIDHNDTNYIEEELYTPACESYSKINDVDLNKIIFKYDIKYNIYNYSYLLQIKKKYKIANFNVPSFFFYVDGDQEIILPDIQFINTGSYGLVFSYENFDKLPTEWEEIKPEGRKIHYNNPNTGMKTTVRPKGDEINDYKIKIAVKTYFKPDDPEINIIRRLNREGIDCNIVNSKILESNGLTVAIMDIMHGSLDKLVNKIDATTIIKIIKRIAYYLHCLYEKGLSYTDLKTGNILFKCINNKLKITLGDLGSICDNGKSGVVTFPPPERFVNRNICNEKSMVWGVGIIMLQLFGHNMQNIFIHRQFNKFYNHIPELSKYVNLELKECNQKNNLQNIKISCDIPGLVDADMLLTAMMFIKPENRLLLKDIMSVTLI